MESDRTDVARVSAVIPTWRRTDSLSSTLQKLYACSPRPGEIIVHIDAGDVETEGWLEQHHLDVRVISSETQVGPGGGRNKLIAAAQYPVVASFDDDSYPIDTDFFWRLERLFEEFRDASIIACAIFHRGEEVQEARRSAGWTSTFVGCGCAYRRDDFLTLDGYLNLPIAYGAEEVDLALQLHNRGMRVLYTDWLRVYHDTLNVHHEAPHVNSAKIANLALLAYVRYPFFMWGYAAMQVMNRVGYALRHQRFAGTLDGLVSIPGRIWAFRGYRSPVRYAALKNYLGARSTLDSAPWPPGLESSASVEPHCPSSSS